MTPARDGGRSGRIVLVGTPIGNLGDLSPRAADALATADVIFCEDTRRTRKLLSAAGIPAPTLVAMHRHNEAAAATSALHRAQSGSTVAVVTDAGMPGVSDPGSLIVRLAADEDLPVEVVPGPSALTAALVVSGMPAEQFCFEGFLPRQGPDRRTRLRRIGSEQRTIVVYEAPHRVVRTLADLAEACGPDRAIAVARELTKLHEEVWRGTLGEAAEWAAAHDPRGEWVLVLAGAHRDARETQPPTDEDIADVLRESIDAGTDRRTAIAEVAAALGIPKREVYRVAVGIGP